MSTGKATCPLLWAAAPGGCPAVWSISHHRGYCCRESTVRSPKPCDLSCGASLLGRRPPPGLCTGSPVTSCFHGSGCRLPRSPMQSGGALTSVPGVQPLLLTPWVGWVAPVRPTHGMWFVVSRPLAALGAHACAASTAILVLLHRRARPACSCVRCLWLRAACSPVHAPGVFCVQCPWPLGTCSPVCPLGVLCCVCGVLATWLLFTGVPALCVVLSVRCPWPLGSFSPVWPRNVLCCVCGVLGPLAPVHPAPPGCVSLFVLSP